MYFCCQNFKCLINIFLFFPTLIFFKKLQCVWRKISTFSWKNIFFLIFCFISIIFAIKFMRLKPLDHNAHVKRDNIWCILELFWIWHRINLLRNLICTSVYYLNNKKIKFLKKMRKCWKEKRIEFECTKIAWLT